MASDLNYRKGKKTPIQSDVKPSHIKTSVPHSITSGLFNH